MASSEQARISKELLETVQLLLTSNAIIDQHQLDSLHQIISNTSQKTTTIRAVSQQEDTTYHQRFTYTFKDEDSLLFTLFGYENGGKMLHVLNGKFIKYTLGLLFGVYVVLGVLTLYIISWDVFLAYSSVLCSFASSYIIGWILYLNKKAMKLLLKQFEFWFKVFYLIQYLIGNAVIMNTNG
eukprot:376860_1